jgi:hypothetical protein
MNYTNVLGTNLYIGVNNVNVIKNLAKIELLLFSNEAAEEQKFIRFFIYDYDTKIEYRLDDSNYWVDNFIGVTNNASSKNISVNFYKKVLFSIDITNNNQANFDINRWFRKIRFVAKVYSKDQTNNYIVENSNGSWSTEEITLISQEVFIPTIKQIDVQSTSTDEDLNLETLNVKLKYDYGLENDFNYTNENLYYQVRLLSVLNRKPFPNGDVILQENGSKDLNPGVGIIEHTFFNLELNDFIIINIRLINPKGVVLKTLSKVYKPFVPKNRMYARFNGKVVEIKKIYVNDINEEYNDNEILDVYKDFDGVDYKKIS